MSKVPKLRFKEFSGEWEEKKLNDVGLITTGSTPSTSISEYYGGERLFISPVDIQGNRYINKTKTTLTELGFSKGRKVEKDSVCFVCIGSTIGKVAQLTEDSLTNQQINCITANNKNFNDFVYSLLELKASKIKLLAGEQALPQINKSDFSKLKFYLPSLQEQEKIASFLISIDTKIEQLIKKEELLKQYKKGVMQKIFNQEIRFKADDGSEFCEWKEKKLEDFLNLTLREVPKPIENYLAIGIRSHCKGTFQKPDSEPHKIAMDKLYVVKENDLIVNITFAWESAIAIVKKEDEGGLVSHRFPTYTFDNNLAIVEFFRYVIIQKKFRLMLDLISPGGAGRNRVMSKKDFLKLKWELPCVEEQNKIANFLSSIDTKIEQTQRQLEQTKEFKKALLQQMFVQ
jgi:type I restriction enzyme S subunit